MASQGKYWLLYYQTLNLKLLLEAICASCTCFCRILVKLSLLLLISYQNNRMQEELRETYVDKIFDLAYNRGDKLLIDTHQDSLRAFVASQKQFHVFDKVQQQLVQVIRALCSRYSQQLDVQEDQQGNKDIVVYKNPNQTIIPKLKVVEIIEANIQDKRKLRQEPALVPKKPSKILTRNKQNSQGQITSLPFKKQDPATANQLISSKQPPHLVDTSAYQTGDNNAIIQDESFDPDYYRQRHSYFGYPQYSFPPYGYGQVQPVVYQQRPGQYKSYQRNNDRRREQGPTTKQQPVQKFNYKEADFPSL